MLDEGANPPASRNPARGRHDRVDLRLRALNIFYDEDESGRYFQVYTPVISDRFFFEVVSRQAYLGFGAPNAPIRLAAQSRLSRHPAVPRYRSVGAVAG